MTLNPGEVEVIVIQDTTFNGPDHRTLGPLKAGDTVTTAAGVYADWLVENGFAAYPEDFKPEGSKELSELDALIAAAEGEGDEGDEGEDGADEIEPETTETPKAQPAKPAKPGPKKKGV